MSEPELNHTTVLIALGGNALSPETTTGTVAEQFAQTRAAIAMIMPFVRQGYHLTITHGNGPQVGDELLRAELAADRVPPQPLGVCVAATQGAIGYMIEQSLQNALLDEGIHRDVVTLITQVLVHENDPALGKPTKFIGERYDESRARRFAERFGWTIGEQDEGAWRRVVPSPTPIRINNARSIKHLVDMGSIVIASGGGGIPAYIMANGHFEGMDAVIDKDLAAAVLGANIRAREMYILTDVPEVYINFHTDRQRPVHHMSVVEAQAFYDAGQFPPGSMGPKIKAAIQFITQGGRKVVLTNIASIAQALAGEGGTIICP